MHMNSQIGKIIFLFALPLMATHANAEITKCRSTSEDQFMLEGEQSLPKIMMNLGLANGYTDSREIQPKVVELIPNVFEITLSDKSPANVPNAKINQYHVRMEPVPGKNVCVISSIVRN